MIGLALLAYNSARFGSWGRFGMRYELAGGNQLQRVFYESPIHSDNLYYYLFAPPQFSAYFPAFEVTGFPFPALRLASAAKRECLWRVAGDAALPCPRRWLRRGLRLAGGARLDELRSFTLVATGFRRASNALFLLMTAGANNRYMIDFVTPMTPLAIAGVMAWESRKPDWKKWLGRAGWTAALGYTLLFNVFVSFQHNELLRYHNPVAYRRLAHAFNHISVWLGKTAPNQVGAARATDPADGPGRQ